MDFGCDCPCHSHHTDDWKQREREAWNNFELTTSINTLKEDCANYWLSRMDTRLQAQREEIAEMCEKKHTMKHGDFGDPWDIGYNAAIRDLSASIRKGE